jgi:hypothetical protein
MGADISTINGQLRMDTTKYLIVGYAKHLRKYKLERQEFDKLYFNNNYGDSIKLPDIQRGQFVVLRKRLRDRIPHATT